MRYVCLFAIWKKEGKKEKPHGTNSRLRAWTALNPNHDGKARRLQGLLAGLGVIFYGSLGLGMMGRKHYYYHYYFFFLFFLFFSFFFFFFRFFVGFCL
jgi:hypothetical protein